MISFHSIYYFLYYGLYVFLLSNNLHLAVWVSSHSNTNLIHPTPTPRSLLLVISHNLSPKQHQLPSLRAKSFAKWYIAGIKSNPIHFKRPRQTRPIDRPKRSNLAPPIQCSSHPRPPTDQNPTLSRSNDIRKGIKVEEKVKNITVRVACVVSWYPFLRYDPAKHQTPPKNAVPFRHVQSYRPIGTRSPILRTIIPQSPCPSAPVLLVSILRSGSCCQTARSVL